MNIKLIRRVATIAVCGMAMLNVHAAAAQGAIDNSALSSPAFREHKRTFGLVYTLPKEVNDTAERDRLRPAAREAAERQALRRGAALQHSARHRAAHPQFRSDDAGEDAQGDAEAAGRAQRDAEDFLHHRGRQGRRPSVVARSRHREGRRGLRGDDGVQHDGDADPDPAARRPAAARHRAGLCGDGRRRRKNWCRRSASAG